MTETRTVEDVAKLASLAKLDLDSLQCHSYCIFIDDDLDSQSQNVRLIEVDATLADLLETEGDISLRSASKSGQVVLCTSGQTFAVQEAETSNSLLLATPSVFDVDLDTMSSGARTCSPVRVEALLHSYLELTKVNTNTFGPQIMRLMKQRKAVLFDDADLHKSSGLALSDLIEEINCSTAELLLLLKAGSYIKSTQTDMWWLLGIRLQSQTITHIFDYAATSCSTWSDLNIGACTKFLDGIADPDVVQVVWHLISDGGRLLSKEKAASIFALDLLEAVQSGSQTAFELNDFVSTWRASLPSVLAESVEFDESLLIGFACVNTQSRPPVVMYIGQDNVALQSPSIKMRLDYLFKLKKRWSLEELHPFVSSLATSCSVEALINKYGRACKCDVNGTTRRLYASRYGN